MAGPVKSTLDPGTQKVTRMTVLNSPPIQHFARIYVFLSGAADDFIFVLGIGL